MRIWSAFLCVATSASAQFIVHDPVNTAVNAAVQAGQAANHVEILREWAAQLEQLDRQLRQLEDQLAVQRRIRATLGDPAAAGATMTLSQLGNADLARSYGETLAAVRRLADAADSLRRTADGIFRPLEDRTVFGRDFARTNAPYRRYAAVEHQADAVADVQSETSTRGSVLQAELAATLEQLRRAGTQAEVDKLQGKIAALNGQLLHIDNVRRDEADKLRVARILNENQAEKEKQDFLEKQLVEEQQTLEAVGVWQASLKLTATDYTRP
jgi:TolA-binding protein